MVVDRSACGSHLSLHRPPRQIRETFDAQTLEPISFIDAGDRVIVRLIWHGVGHGPDLNLEVSSVNTLRKGTVILLEYFWDHAEALETLGLSE